MVKSMTGHYESTVMDTVRIIHSSVLGYVCMLQPYPLIKPQHCYKMLQPGVTGCLIMYVHTFTVIQCKLQYCKYTIPVCGYVHTSPNLAG